MQDVREYRFTVEQWIDAQPKCPTRKEVVAKFPHAPQRVIRAAIQSREDRERKAESKTP